MNTQITAKLNYHIALCSNGIAEKYFRWIHMGGLFHLTPGVIGQLLDHIS